MPIAGLEWIIVAAVIILIFFGGGKKITEFARSLGRAAGEFKKGKEEAESELHNIQRSKRKSTRAKGRKPRRR